MEYLDVNLRLRLRQKSNFTIRAISFVYVPLYSTCIDNAKQHSVTWLKFLNTWEKKYYIKYYIKVEVYCREAL